MPRIFISYRRNDSSSYAGRLYDRLSAYFDPSNVFMDIATVKPGEEFAAVIYGYIQSCDALIALIGRQWLTSVDDEGHRRIDNPQDFVRLEIAAAISHKITIIPALVGGANLPSHAQDLPEELRAMLQYQAKVST